MDKSYRIVAFVSFSSENGWEYPKKYFYDNTKKFNSMVKTHKTQCSRYNTFATKLVIQEFVDNQWKTLEEWYSPNCTEQQKNKQSIIP